MVSRRSKQQYPIIARNSLSYDFPLRPDYTAQLVLPKQFFVADAERLCAFIKALAQPETQDE